MACHGSGHLEGRAPLLSSSKHAHQPSLMGEGKRSVPLCFLRALQIELAVEIGPLHSLARFCAERGMNPAAMARWCGVRNVTN